MAPGLGRAAKATMAYHHDSPAKAGLAGITQNFASLPKGARWYAVQCLAHREVAASSHLQNQQHQVFFPRRQKVRRHARKTDAVLVSFFPGYLFVALDLSRHRWRSVNGTYGVASLVMHGDRPAPVPVGVVEALQHSCDDRSVIQWQPDLKPGQAVRILAGPFGDFVGELERLDGAGRVRVLLEIMGGRVPAVLPKEIVVSRDSVV